MRRFFLLLAALTLACRAPAAAADKKLTVVATVFPAYDWVRVILGERVGQVRLKLEELRLYDDLLKGENLA